MVLLRDDERWFSGVKGWSMEGGVICQETRSQDTTRDVDEVICDMKLEEKRTGNDK